MAANSSNSSKGKSGNTRQISPSKHWCFTLNNYTIEDIELICSNSSIEKYIFQEEVGELGTPHLQGYMKFKTKVRPKSVFKTNKISWGKTKDIKASIVYCQKEDTRAGKIFTKGIKIIKPLKCLKIR
ncbi:replication protein, partial [uncultured marine virus]